MRNIKTDLQVGSRQSVHVSLDDVLHSAHVDGDYIILGVADDEYSNACFITLTRTETYRLVDVLKNALAVAQGFHKSST